jgi:hypothetical protein
MKPPTASSSSSTTSGSLGLLVVDTAAGAVTDICINVMRRVSLSWPGAAPMTAAAVRPCFQPVVDLAWAVLQAAAAAGQFVGGGNSSSSSSSSSAWDCHIAAVVRLAAAFSAALAGVLMQSSALALMQAHAQQFASDTLLKLLMLPAGLLIQELHRKQQGQPGQVCVQPYHQQLLEELKLELNEQQSGMAGADAGRYGALHACAAVAFAMQMRRTAAESSSSSSSSSSEQSIRAGPAAVASVAAGGSSCSSGSEQSIEAGMAAQPAAVAAAAAAAAATPGISGRLSELLLLTTLECVVLTPATDVYRLADALTYGVDVYECVHAPFSSPAAGAAAAAVQQSEQPASDALLQALVLEVGPAAMQGIRSASVAGSAALAAQAAADGSVAAEEALASSVDTIRRSLALLYDGALSAGELPHAWRC